MEVSAAALSYPYCNLFSSVLCLSVPHCCCPPLNFIPFCKAVATKSTSILHLAKNPKCETQHHIRPNHSFVLCQGLFVTRVIPTS